jgi:hypothetical protein
MEPEAGLKILLHRVGNGYKKLLALAFVVIEQLGVCRSGTTSLGTDRILCGLYRRTAEDHTDAIIPWIRISCEGCPLDRAGQNCGTRDSVYDSAFHGGREENEKYLDFLLGLYSQELCRVFNDKKGQDDGGQDDGAQASQAYQAKAVVEESD